MNEEHKQLIQKSYLFWGRQSQFDQLHEELGELIVALNHFKRNRCTLKDVAIEMADVRLMLNAIQVILGIDDQEYAAIEDGQWTKWKSQLNASIEKHQKAAMTLSGHVDGRE